MLKDFILFIKYPYTAGIIAIIWLGSAALLAIDRDLPFVRIVLVDMIITILLSIFGFRGKKEI
jgi:hypothetical protein